MSNKFYIVLVVMTLALAAGFKARAHGAGVTTQSADIGNYTIEFEYDSLTPVYSQSEYNYSFRLLDKSSKASKDFDFAYVEFIRPRVGLADVATLHPIDTGLTALGTVLPDADDYTVNVNFTSGGKVVAQASFIQHVLPNPALAVKKSHSSIYFWIGATGLVILSLLAGLLLGSKKHRTANP